jgi:LysM domain
VVTRNAAPAAALLAVTAAVLAIHYGVQKRPSHAPPPPVTQTIPHYVHSKRTAAIRRFYTVQRGDSFSAIADRTHTSVARLEQLNPGVSPTALHVGQRIRVK